MATYDEIQKEFRCRFGKTIKTCWIADVKERHRLTRGPAHNRKGAKRENPCPESLFPKIESVLKHFKMI